MDVADVELSPDVYTRAIETNLRETFGLLGSAVGESVRAGGTLAFFTGVPIPMFNGVVSPNLAPDNADTYIEWFIDQARTRKVPMMWQVGPSSKPADIGDRLLAHGFVAGGTIPGLAVDLASLTDEALPDGVSVTQVRDIDTLKDVVELMCGVFGIPLAFLDTFLRMFGAGGPSDDAPIVTYVARSEGRMVGGSTVVYADGVAGIYNVATVDDCRGRGIGRAVTLAPLLDARDKGYRIGILQSSTMGLSVYRRLGFDQYCEFNTYSWSEDEAPGE